MLASIVQQRLGALLVSPDPFFIAQRDQLVSLALHHSVPSGYHRREFPVSGGFMSYGPSLMEGYRQVAIYAGKILKGAKPADLPVEQSGKFELVINLVWGDFCQGCATRVLSTFSSLSFFVRPGSRFFVL